MDKLSFDGIPTGVKPYEFCKKCERIHQSRIAKINEDWFKQFVEHGKIKNQALHEAKTASEYWKQYWKDKYNKKLEQKEKEFEKKLADIEATLASDYPIWHE